MKATLTLEGIARLEMTPAGPVGRIIEGYTLATEGVAKILMLTPGSGRLYTTNYYTRIKGAPRGTPGRLGQWGSRPPHRASAPGEPAASDTGFEMNSIGHSIYLGANGIEGRVVIHAFYGLYTELGTRYMEPRPVLRPALSAAMAMG